MVLFYEYFFYQYFVIWNLERASTVNPLKNSLRSTQILSVTQQSTINNNSWVILWNNYCNLGLSLPSLTAVDIIKEKESIINPSGMEEELTAMLGSLSCLRFGQPTAPKGHSSCAI